MIKKNIFATVPLDQTYCHGGEGTIKFRRILEKEFNAKISFLDYTILPPGTSIGFHQHVHNEEVYIILKGKGLMAVDAEETEVGEGDVILTPSQSSHGLKNHTAHNLEILVFEGRF